MKRRTLASSTTAKARIRPSKADRRRSQTQETIDDEVESFASYVSSSSFALASRTNDPVAIVRILAAGVGMITAQFVARPSKPERRDLEDAMTALTVASNGILVANLANRTR